MSIEFDSLKLTDKVLLASLVKCFPSNKTKLTFSDLLEYDLSPAPYVTVHILAQLASANLIGWTGKKFSNKSLLQDEDAYKIFEITLNVESTEDLLQGLLLQINSTDKHSKQDNRDIVTLIKNVLVAECVQFISEQLSLTFFDIDLLMNPPAVLVEILEHYPLAETHTLLWMAAAKISPKKINEEHAADLLSEICHSAQRSALLYAANKSIINPYQKIEGPECSLLTVLLMENYLKLGSGRYFTSHVWPILSKNARLCSKIS